MDTSKEDRSFFFSCVDHSDMASRTNLDRPWSHTWRRSERRVVRSRRCIAKSLVAEHEWRTLHAWSMEMVEEVAEEED